MGFKTTNYEIPRLGLTIGTAYAQITNLSIDTDSTAKAIIRIQQTRDAISTNRPLDRKFIEIKIDKDLPAHKQVYEYAKSRYFSDWEDDIVEETEDTVSE